MSNSTPQRPASEIPVKLFREIFLWPLALHLPEPARDPQEIKCAVTQCAKAIAEPWRQATYNKLPDTIAHIPPPAADVQQWEIEAYAEAVYFHEFVQSFLFRRQTDQSPGVPPFWLFQRDDVEALTVHSGERSRRFGVKRLNLYLFRTGVAILALEAEAEAETAPDKPLFLNEVLNLHDYMRRAYAPYLETKPVLKAPHLVLSGLTWHARKNGALKDEHFPIGIGEIVATIKDFVDKPQADGRRAPPVFAHWRWLLPEALPLAGYAQGGAGQPVWRQVVDERMPTIATVSVSERAPNDDVREGDEKEKEKDAIRLTHYRTTRRGDLIRLCFADDYGPDEYFYDESFLRDFETDHVYERFRSRGALFLVSSYSFVAFGAGKTFDNHVATHTRRHYFQMCLIAQFELVSLLTYSSWISQAVERYERNGGAEEFEQMMHAIEEEFLQFVHRFRFTGVSNQLQAQELFDLLRKRMNLAALFDDLRTEITTATSYLFNRAATRASRAAQQLSLFATVGIVLGLAVGVLGMNLLVDKDLLADARWLNPAAAPTLPLLGHVAVVAGVFSAILLLGASLALSLGRPARRLFWWLGGAGAAAVAAAIYTGRLLLGG